MIRRLLLLPPLLAFACSQGRAPSPESPTDASGSSSPAADGGPARCPLALPAPHLLPGSRPEHRQAGYWISRLESPDEVVLGVAEIAELNRRARALTKDGILGVRADLLAGPVDPAPVVEEMSKGLARHRERAGEGARVSLEGARPPGSFFDGILRIQREAEAVDEIRMAQTLTPLRCHPSEEGLYEHAGDVDFDLFLCTNVRPGELLRVVSRHPDGWRLVRTAYAYGWARQDDLGPELSQDEARAYLTSQRFVVVRHDRSPVWTDGTRTAQLVAVDLGLRLPLLGRDPSGMAQVLVPSREGRLAPGLIDADDVEDGYLPLTRRSLLGQAFARLDDAFGWAGAGGDRDCSRFLMDIFALFGLELPRNSYWQSRAGTTSVDVTGLDASQRAEQLDRALDQGIVLLYMPGHIMLLLGRDGDDYYAIHQFSGYRVGCRPGHDVKMTVDRVSVTTLRLGEGSERGSFMERITHVVVLGGEEPRGRPAP